MLGLTLYIRRYETKCLDEYLWNDSKLTLRFRSVTGSGKSGKSIVNVVIKEYLVDSARRALDLDFQRL